MERENAVELMSHFSNPIVTKIIFEEDDEFTLLEENGKNNEKTVCETSYSSDVTKKHPMLQKLLDSIGKSPLDRQSKKKRKHTDLEANTDQATNKKTKYTFNATSMLDLVSEHLIHIIKYLNHYSPNIEHSWTMQYLESIQRKKNAVKCFFFRHSYSTTLMLLIPQENDVDFVFEFIDGTVKLAQKLKTETTFTDVFSLYSEMLAWTKAEYKKIQDSLVLLNNTTTAADPPPYSFSQVTDHPTPRHPEVNQCRSKTSSTMQDKQTQMALSAQEKSPIEAFQTSLSQAPTWVQQSYYKTMPQPIPISPYSRQKRQPSVHYEHAQMQYQRNIRSTSRDSGIASPSPNMESTMCETQSPYFSPQIINVESQCPVFTAKRPTLGACFVCKSMTTKMCMGCFSVYYCSVDCQFANFRVHKGACKRKT